MESSTGSRTHLKNNIPKYHLAMIFRNLWISMPISILYYTDRGVSFFQMGIIEAVIAMVIILTDIPSGAFSDIFGRKLSTSLGMGLWGVSMILTGLSTEFFVYIIGAVLLGIGDSLISGAEKALIYDSLKELDITDKYIKIQGQRSFYSAFSIIIASFLGVFLYTIDIAYPLYAHGTTCLIAGIIIFTMKEPTKSEHPKTIRAQYSLIIKSVSFTVKTKIVRFITIFSIIVLCVPMVFVNIMEQPYLTDIGIPLEYFGIIFAFTRGVIGFFGPLRYTIEKKLGEKGSFYGITIIFTVMIILMALLYQPISLLFMFILFFTRDYSWTIFDKYANDHISSDKRATVLSIMNFGLNVAYIVFALFIGFGLDNLTFLNFTSIQAVLLCLAGFCLLIIIPFLGVAYRKEQGKIGSEKIC